MIDKNFLLTLDRSTMDKVRNIDSFVLKYIEEHDLKDSKQSYNKTLNTLLKIAGIDENEKPMKIIDKMSILVLLKQLM